MTSDEFSGVMGAEGVQQEADGRVRAEKPGSEYRSRPLKAQMEAKDYITTFKETILYLKAGFSRKLFSCFYMDSGVHICS